MTVTQAPAGSRGHSNVALDDLATYRRAANYLAAAQVYLRSNALLREPLRAEHVKPRLLGHWGTSPGINLIYAHLNRAIVQRGANVLLVTGPGHGAAANLANHYLDGSLAEFYPDMTLDAAGVERFVRAFSWPGGFPSHLVPGTPGTIYEGGELGYSLATAVGAALDNPDLIAVCIVGDGEAETGPLATSWNSNRFLEPRTSGAVLPILHANGFKISSATITGTMTDDELVELFAGYGWQPHVVAGDDEEIDQRMAAAVDQSFETIAEVQVRARGGERVTRPRWPMIVLRTPKGWTGPAEVDGKRVAGSWRSHQVPAANLRRNPAHLAVVESWLRSYRPDELWDDTGRPVAGVLRAVPRGKARMGMNPHAVGGRVRRALDLPDAQVAAVSVPQPGTTDVGALDQAGAYLAEVMRRSEAERNFRIFCPDELESNKLGAVLKVTNRAFTWTEDDADSHFAPDGRVIEVLSEHLCEGFLEGYLKTGRHGLFPCYEAFIQIADSMIAQFAKWLKVESEVDWRPPISSLNILLTSDAWRQDHNGYSHQNPGFINSLLTKKGSVLRITLPPDANTLVETVERCLRSVGYINLVIATKQPLPQWLSMEQAKAHATAGVSIWRWASTDEGVDPDVVLAAAGMVPTNEILAAADLLRQDVPDLRLRVVNVMDLMRLDSRGGHPHALPADAFEQLFTRDRHIVFSFHGYPSAIHQLISARPEPTRFHVRGYVEEGITTTPFDMLIRNGVSRYQLAIEAIRRAGMHVPGATAAVDRYLLRLEEHLRYIIEHGEDPEDITAWRWTTR
ncbi:MAG TPA: phosphoketolase family protein [Candidatus Limnocylindria bacterium]|nr:phosphoketolase family protein [Candidatus Limnocylindria bacterium]